jgi:hypothetical protein
MWSYSLVPLLREQLAYFDHAFLQISKSMQFTQGNKTIELTYLGSGHGAIPEDIGRSGLIIFQ